MPEPDQADRPGLVVTGLRRFQDHPWLMGSFVLIGLLLGAGYSVVQPASYTAQSTMLVGTFEAPAQAIPGYVLTSQTVAGNYARIAMSSTVMAPLADELQMSEADVRAKVAVAAVPESAIVRAVATSSSEDEARRIAEAMATTLAQTVGELNAPSSGDATLTAYENAFRDLTAATAAQAAAKQAFDSTSQTTGANSQQTKDAKAVLDAASLTQSTAQLKVDGLIKQYTTEKTNSSTSSDLRVLGASRVTKDSNLFGTVLSALVGAVLGALAGFGLIWWRARGSRQSPVATHAEGPDDPMADILGYTDPVYDHTDELADDATVERSR